jgi:hypothetical protein
MITIKKFEKDACRPCAILDNYIAEISGDVPFVHVKAADFNDGGLDKYVASLTDQLPIIHVNIADMTDEQLESERLTGVPVLKFYRNGVEMARLNGLVNPQEILDAIEHTKEAK